MYTNFFDFVLPDPSAQCGRRSLSSSEHAKRSIPDMKCATSVNTNMTKGHIKGFTSPRCWTAVVLPLDRHWIAIEFLDFT